MMLNILATVSETIDEARNAFAENSTLFVAVGATILVGWWMFKKLFKLAIYAGVIGAGAWYWYFNIKV